MALYSLYNKLPMTWIDLSSTNAKESKLAFARIPCFDVGAFFSEKLLYVHSPLLVATKIS